MLKNQEPIIRIMLVVLFVSSCTHAAINSPSNLPTTTREENDLHLKVEELEAKVQDQQDRIDIIEKVLEKQEQRETAPTVVTEKKPETENEAILSEVKISTPKEKKIKETKTSLSENLNQYRIRMEFGKRQFSKREWNKAYLTFSSSNREFPLDISNSEPLYWMGRCWFQLKEYHSANSLFKQFLNTLPEQSLRESAELYSAKSDLNIGNMGEARKTLNRLISKSPNGANAKMARELLKSKQYHKEEVNL